MDASDEDSEESFFISSDVSDDDADRTQPSKPLSRWRRVLHWANRVHSPKAGWKLKWDICMVVLLLYNALEITTRLGFDQEVDVLSFIDIINLLTDCFFMIDILMTFRTGFFEDYVLVSDQKRITSRYLHGLFALDFVSSFPFSHLIFLLGGGYSSATRASALLRSAKIIRLVKLYRVYKLFTALHRWENEDWGFMISVALRAFKFILLVFLTVHVAACGWMLVALEKRDENLNFHPHSWIVRFHPEEYITKYEQIGVTRAYVLSFYWCMSTITTVGYGDISSRLEEELVYAIFVIMIGTMMFGYVISNVSSMFTRTDEASRLLKQKTKSLGEYMRQRRLPKDLCAQMIAHHEFIWKRKSIYDESMIIEQLPTHLRLEVSLFLNKKLIESVPFLQNIESTCLSMFLLNLEPLQLSAGMYVYKAGSLGRDMFFIASGDIDVIQPRLRTEEEAEKEEKEGDEEKEKVKEDILCILTTGAYFGEVAILMEHAVERIYSMRSRSFVELYSLSKANFSRILKLYPDLEQRVRLFDFDSGLGDLAQQMNNLAAEVPGGYPDPSSFANASQVVQATSDEQLLSTTTTATAVTSTTAASASSPNELVVASEIDVKKGCLNENVASNGNHKQSRSKDNSEHSFTRTSVDSGAAHQGSFSASKQKDDEKTDRETAKVGGGGSDEAMPPPPRTAHGRVPGSSILCAQIPYNNADLPLQPAFHALPHVRRSSFDGHLSLNTGSCRINRRGSLPLDLQVGDMAVPPTTHRAIGKSMMHARSVPQTSNGTEFWSRLEAMQAEFLLPFMAMTEQLQANQEAMENMLAAALAAAAAPHVHPQPTIELSPATEEAMLAHLHKQEPDTLASNIATKVQPQPESEDSHSAKDHVTVSF